ncbi:MAG: alpha/beta hydrolase [Candidatus Anammoximicrobium sp.]|nr:alpha/beta hydrolase [Candidatus Anammoximicrobium sp.]
MRQLVFVHGRAQEHKDAATLKGEWLATLRQGLAKSQLELPIPEDAVRFPYYGQTLFDLVSGVPADQAAEVIVRGAGEDSEQRTFAQAIIGEICEQNGITDEQIAGEAAGRVVERGPLNWEWVQAALRAIDRVRPASAATIALITNDVYQYLRNPGIRDQIETGIRQAMQPGVPTVVVGHSLGSVVAYSLLRRDGPASGWRVPLYLTVGCPLGVTAIKRALAPNHHPQCVDKWFNAMDDRDVVALYPLSRKHFPISPEIENKTDVDNQTPNRHGIIGYLNDREVARRIYDALVA